jgi:hypothetical protein
MKKKKWIDKVTLSISKDALKIVWNWEASDDFKKLFPEDTTRQYKFNVIDAIYDDPIKGKIFMNYYTEYGYEKYDCKKLQQKLLQMLENSRNKFFDKKYNTLIYKMIWIVRDLKGCLKNI